MKIKTIMVEKLWIFFTKKASESFEIGENGELILHTPGNITNPKDEMKVVPGGADVYRTNLEWDEEESKPWDIEQALNVVLDQIEQIHGVFSTELEYNPNSLIASAFVYVTPETDADNPKLLTTKFREFIESFLKEEKYREMR